MEYTDEQIQVALNRYTKNKEYKKNYYRNKYQTDPDYVEKMKSYSKSYYINNKDKRKEQYDNNAEFLKARRKFNYYSKQDNVEKYIEKYPDEYNKFFNQAK